MSLFEKGTDKRMSVKDRIKRYSKLQVVKADSLRHLDQAFKNRRISKFGM